MVVANNIHHGFHELQLVLRMVGPYEGWTYRGPYGNCREALIDQTILDLDHPGPGPSWTSALISTPSSRAPIIRAPKKRTRPNFWKQPFGVQMRVKSSS